MKTRSHVAAPLLLLLALGGCGGSDEAPPPDQGPAATGETTAAGADLPATHAISILTASKTGNYYKAATELAEVMAGSPYALKIEESPGSYHNLQQLGTGKVNLAIAQFDTLMVFMAMDKAFQDMANNCLVLAPLGLEVVHIVVNKKAKIKTLKDLVGKRIAAGPPHSGSWISAFNVMFYLNKVDINAEATKDVANLPYEEMIPKLVAGELDAVFVTSAPGMPLLKDVAPADAKSLALLGLDAKFRLPKDLAWSYSVQEIAAGTYPYQKKKVSALATRSFLLSNRDFDTAKVTALAQIIYDNADKLRAKSDIWKLASREKAAKDIAEQFPYHDGVTQLLGKK